MSELVILLMSLQVVVLLSSFSVVCIICELVGMMQLLSNSKLNKNILQAHSGQKLLLGRGFFWTMTFFGKIMDLFYKCVPFLQNRGYF